jgi:protein SCO1/2
MKLARTLLAVGTLIGAVALVGAQNSPPPSGPSPLSPTSGLALVQKLDAQVPLDAKFKDETGRDVVLGEYLGKKPVVLMLVFYRCAGTCALEFDSMTQTLRAFKTEKLGRDFDVVTISIHPKETPELAAETKRDYVEKIKSRQPDAAQGWHFLTGEYEQARKVADSVGYSYVWDPVKEIVRHPAGIMVLTPEGRVSRYFYGVEFPAKPLSDALVQASSSQIGPKAEEILLGCIMYDPQSGKYTVNIRRALSFAAALTVVVLVMSMVVMGLSNRRRARAGDKEGGDSA